MRFFKGALKAVIIGKLLQVAQRELSKPENQRKAKDMVRNLRNR